MSESEHTNDSEHETPRVPSLITDKLAGVIEIAACISSKMPHPRMIHQWLSAVSLKTCWSRMKQIGL